jgi:flavin reductase (DIM6/NTAB) family NADH-FMN oxidoreductase RutF
MTPTISPEVFRLVMGHFVTGVTVVTALDDGQPSGITVNALSSISLEPPLVMIALDRRRFLTPIIHASGRYGVNILSEDQQDLAECFAGAPTVPDRAAFCGAAWRAGSTGVPLLDGTVAALECSVVESLSVGDHDLFIGRVEALHRGGAAMPLAYHRRTYLGIDRSPRAGTPAPDEA